MKKNNIGKILLVIPEFSSFYPMIKQAFDLMGQDYVIFDNRKSNLIEKVVVLTSIFIPFFKNKHQLLINRRLVNFTKKNEPSLILVIKGENIYPQTIINLNKNAITVNWFPDSLPNFKLAEAWLSTYNFLFIADNYIVKLYSKKGYKNIFHLPLAGMKIDKIPIKKTYDVVFIGVHNPEREKLFLSLKDLNFKIWGSPAWGRSKLAKNYQGQWLSAPEILEVLKKTKIVVNLHQNYHRQSTIINLRIYEATSCQSLIITDYWSDLDKLYSVGKDLIIYKDGIDLKQKVEYYLDHEDERKRIAVNGYKKLNAKNTYNQRFKQMFKIIFTQRA